MNQQGKEECKRRIREIQNKIDNYGLQATTRHPLRE